MTMNQKKQKKSPSATGPKTWLRIDANTVILVASKNATPEYAERYRRQLENYRKHFHRYD